MRWGTAVLMTVLAVGLAGCSSPTPAVSTAPPATTATASAPVAALTADGAFEKPILCRAVFDYETVQAAIGTGKLATVHTAGTAAAKDAAAGYAAEQAHAWAPGVQPLLKPYLAVGAQKVAYYRAVAAATSVDEATKLVWPDGTTVSAPVYATVGIRGSLTCPR